MSSIISVSALDANVKLSKKRVRNRDWHRANSGPYKGEWVSCRSPKSFCGFGQHLTQLEKPNTFRKIEKDISIILIPVIIKNKKNVTVAAKLEVGSNDSTKRIIILSKGTEIFEPKNKRSKLYKKFEEMDKIYCDSGNIILNKTTRITISSAAQILKDSAYGLNGNKHFYTKKENKTVYNFLGPTRTQKPKIRYPILSLWIVQMNSIPDYKYIFGTIPPKHLNKPMGYNDNKITVICKKCHHEFTQTTRALFLEEFTCPKCKPIFSSRDEQEIIKEIKIFKEYNFVTGKEAYITGVPSTGSWTSTIAKPDILMNGIIVLETDGYYTHYNEERAQKDADKTQALLNMGHGVVRVRYLLKNAPEHHLLDIRNSLYREINGTNPDGKMKSKKQIAAEMVKAGEDILISNPEMKLK